jgi:hypothetical protein
MEKTAYLETTYILCGYLVFLLMEQDDHSMKIIAHIHIEMRAWMRGDLHPCLTVYYLIVGTILPLVYVLFL